MTDATLRVTIRAALIAYRETVIYKHWAGDQTRRKRCILRRDMIEHLIARRPFTVKAWMDSLPRGMRDKTDMGQVQAHGESIIEIIREQRVRAYRRHVKKKVRQERERDPDRLSNMLEELRSLHKPQRR